MTLNSLIRSAPVPLVLVDTDLRILDFSMHFAQAFHLNPDELAGSETQKIFPDFPDSLRTAFSELMETGKSTFRKLERFSREDHSEFWLEWSANPVRDDSEDITGLMIQLEPATIAARQQEMLKKSLEVAQIGGWKLDLQENTLEWTKVTKAIHEVPEDYEPDLETGINFYKEGIHRETIQRLVNHAIQTGEGYDTQLIIVTANGAEKWVRAKGETEFINGKCASLFGTFEDIDHRKRSELKYRIVSERLSKAIEAAEIGVWELDILKNELIWDETMYDLYGVRKDDFSGSYQAWESLVHPDDLDKTNEKVAEALAGSQDFDTEFRIISPNGEIRHIRGKGKVERSNDGRPLKFIGANWDTTELVLTQLKLQRSEESFQGAFERSATGMALVGLDGSWIEVNQSLCKSVGYERDELLKLTFQDITHPEDLDKDLGLLGEVVKGERNSYSIEKRYYHKKGHLVYVVLTVTGVKDVDGKLTHFISQILDISQRTEAEKRLKSLVQITKEQNASLLNFAHIVSHNLRSHSTNMAMLTNFLDLEEDAKERQNIVAMLKSASSGLSETVEHLNEVVQVKTGALENIRSINLLNAVRSVVQNINAKLREKNTQLDIHIPRAHFVEAVPAYLDSILLNLFTNAVKYSKEGKDLTLRISSQKRRGMITIKFSDNGQGIDLDRHGNKIFGMYKTFHHHPEAKGIGLFITKNQVESMNGTITVDSEPGEGTTFTIQLQEG